MLELRMDDDQHDPDEMKLMITMLLLLLPMITTARNDNDNAADDCHEKYGDDSTHKHNDHDEYSEDAWWQCW